MSHASGVKKMISVKELSMKSTSFWRLLTSAPKIEKINLLNGNGAFGRFGIIMLRPTDYTDKSLIPFTSG